MEFGENFPNIDDEISFWLAGIVSTAESSDTLSEK